RRDPAAGRSLLAIWEIAESPEERRAEEERRRREEERLRDPSEVADRPQEPRPRAPRWTLPRENGMAAADPRWSPDGRGVLFARGSQPARLDRSRRTVAGLEPSARLTRRPLDRGAAPSKRPVARRDLAGGGRGSPGMGDLRHTPFLARVGCRRLEPVADDGCFGDL